jgi:hypothetical protein
MLRIFPIAAAALAVVLAACSPPEPAGQESADAAAVEPADYGRGGVLTQTIDRIEQRRQEAAASGVLSPPEAEEVATELSAVRVTLTDLLSKTQGPLAQADRQLVAQRLAMIESRIDRAPSP